MEIWFKIISFLKINKKYISSNNTVRGNFQFVHYKQFCTYEVQSILLFDTQFRYTRGCVASLKCHDRLWNWF